jgi:ubiquinol-cytochrome c reductase cytochrome c1 subunit
MSPPLYGDDVEFADGAPTDIASTSQDVAAFLMWTAEPNLPARKSAGFIGVLMLAILAVLLYLTNKRIWAPLKKRMKADTAAE